MSWWWYGFGREKGENVGFENGVRSWTFSTRRKKAVLELGGWWWHWGRWWRSAPRWDRRCCARHDDAPGTTLALTVRITCGCYRGRWREIGWRRNIPTQLSERCRKHRYKVLRHEDWLHSHRFLHNAKLVTHVSVSGYLCDACKTDYPCVYKWLLMWRLWSPTLHEKKNQFFLIGTIYYIG